MLGYEMRLTTKEKENYRNNIPEDIKELLKGKLSHPGLLKTGETAISVNGGSARGMRAQHLINFYYKRHFSVLVQCITGTLPYSKHTTLYEQEILI